MAPFTKRRVAERRRHSQGQMDKPDLDLGPLTPKRLLWLDQKNVKWFRIGLSSGFWCFRV